MPIRKEFHQQPPPVLKNGVPVPQRFVMMVPMHCVERPDVVRVEHEGDARIRIDLAAPDGMVEVYEDPDYNAKLEAVAKRLQEQGRAGLSVDQPKLEPRRVATHTAHKLTFWVTPITATELIDQIRPCSEMWKRDLIPQAPATPEQAALRMPIDLGHCAGFDTKLLRADLMKTDEQSSWLGTEVVNPDDKRAPDYVYFFTWSEDKRCSMRACLLPDAAHTLAEGLMAALSTVTKADWEKQRAVIGNTDQNTLLFVGKVQEDTTKPLPPAVENSPRPPRLGFSP